MELNYLVEFRRFNTVNESSSMSINYIRKPNWQSWYVSNDISCNSI